MITFCCGKKCISRIIKDTKTSHIEEYECEICGDKGEERRGMERFKK